VIDQAKQLRESFASSTTRPKVSNVSVLPGADMGTGPGIGPDDAGISKCHSIAITSGKGGVGKSNICLAMACALSKLGKKVLLVDADLGLANIHILLGISPKKSLSQYLKKECALSEVIVDGPGGIQIIPGASAMESLADMESLQLGILTRELVMLEKQYDFLLIDTGAGIGRVVSGFCTMANMVALIVTPEPTSLADAYAIVKVLYKNRQNNVSVIVNMASNDRDGVETFDRLNALVVKFLSKPLQFNGTVPFDKQVGLSVRKQAPLVISQPHSLFSDRIMQCARAYCRIPMKRKRGFFSRLLHQEI